MEDRQESSFQIRAQRSLKNCIVTRTLISQIMEIESEHLVDAVDESRASESLDPKLDDGNFESVDYGYEDGEKDDIADVVNNSSRVERRLNVMGEHCPYTISYRPGRFLFYSQPRQRQKWGESQILPRVNWGDLFFDLFYVGATYNVSNILSDSPNAEGFLYAAGTFVPLMGLWMDKVYYDGRFVYEDDFCHQLLQVCYLVVLGTAVLHVRSVDMMSNVSNEISMFMFAFMLVLGRVVMMIQYLDVYFFGVGQAPVVKLVALRAIKTMALASAFYVAAMIVAALKYFGDSSEISANAHLRSLASANETAITDYGVSKTETTNIPIILCLIGILCTQLSMVIGVKFFFPGGGRHKESTIPLNVDLIIHRNGEWIMLMLGESIFSLLIVDVPEESHDFYTVFCLGILTVIHLQFLHFWSQPHHADSHAVRRHKDAGVWWNIFNIIYSLALLSLGASFTIFLTSSTEPSERRRYLATNASSSLDMEQLKEYASHLFSAMLATIFACLDVMTVLHLGIKESHDRCICKQTRERNRKGILLLTLRLGLIVFTATLSQWRDEPRELCFIGFLCVFAQLVLRQLGDLYLGHVQVHASAEMSGGPKSDQEIGESQWPNVTHARAESEEE